MSRPSPERQLITIQQAAAHLSCNPKTIRRRIASGDLTGYRLGRRVIRVDASEVDALLHPIPTARGGAA